MPFEKGHKLSPGRPKGSINKKSQAFADTLEAKGFDLAKALLEIYELALHEYNTGNVDNKIPALKVAGDMVKEMATYLLPKLKSIEVIKSNPLENMTREEKLIAMKHAVSLLEREVKENG